MGHDRSLSAGGEEQEVDRLRYLDPLPDVQECAVLHQHGVEIGERVRRRPGEAGHEHLPLSGQGFGKAPKMRSGGERPTHGKIRAIPPVREHEDVPGRISRENPGDGGWREPPVARRREPEPLLFDSRDARVFPILVLHAREPGGQEPLLRLVPKAAQPGRPSLSVHRLFERGKITIPRLGGQGHGRASSRPSASGAWTQPYPRSSSSSARFRPPDRTILPSTRTCTKSGTM